MYEQPKYFYENDLSKQDRQTDKPLIEVEMELYKLVGVHPDIVDLWS